MKDLMNRVRAFVTFATPLQISLIREQFSETHEKLEAETPGWSTTATRQTMISNYWSKYAIGHFAFLYGIPAVIFFLAEGGFYQPNLYLAIILIAGLITYIILYVFHYRPNFNSIYLPNLETVKETYEHKQIEQLAKCRQAQLSNFSLSLFFWVLADINGLNILTCDDHSANLLMKLYGVDPGSMKKSLELILGTSKRKNMKNRQKTEIRNRFAETYDYLEALNFNVGIDRLKQLEANFFRE